MTSWHVNEGLAPLVGQMHSAFPGIVIGTIGDAAHQAEKSDHNPNAAGRVNAADLMLGKAFTETAAIALLPFLIADKRTHYVIHDRRIWTSETGRWSSYGGANPHTGHVHISVNDSAHTDTRPWVISAGKISMTKIETVWPALQQGDLDQLLPGYDQITRWQRITGAVDDGVWGPATTAAIAKFCKIPAARATKMTETIFRELLGLPEA